MRTQFSTTSLSLFRSLQVLCVSPVAPSHDPALALRATSGEAVWRCLLGGKKIKPGMALVARQPPETAQVTVDGLAHDVERECVSSPGGEGSCLVVGVSRL